MNSMIRLRSIVPNGCAALGRFCGQPWGLADKAIGRYPLRIVVNSLLSKASKTEFSAEHLFAEPLRSDASFCRVASHLSDFKLTTFRARSNWLSESCAEAGGVSATRKVIIARSDSVQPVATPTYPFYIMFVNEHVITNLFLQRAVI